jgi:hypothetical protein
MSPVKTEEPPIEISSEELQNTETPQYRITFGTFVLRVPVSSD